MKPERWDDPAALARAMAIDLQWFAAEDEGRTEEPSEHKIRTAREEGRVAKSQELVGALVLLLPAVILLLLAPSMLRTCVEMLRFYFLRATELDPAKDRIILQSVLVYFIRLVLPIVAVSMAAALLANLVQIGFLFTTKPLIPNFSRIVPRFGQYFRRTLFSVEGLFNLIKSIAKMAIIGGVAFFLIRSKIALLVNLQRATLWQGVSTVATLAIQLLIITGVLLLVLSIPDILFQRWQYRESLKMSRQEVKEELKMYEGDPTMRARIRQKMRELLSRNMLVNVPRADVVITNPTHLSVALEYDQNLRKAPRVIAKGADLLALRIREIAGEHGIPLMENKPLARALYAETEIGDFIPPKYYEVVASILSRVYALDAEKRRTRGLGA
ncbi:MAG: flagellar biosynthesis protein FlhB [Treponema sp.]|jgi:flagellar biosynthetic protein FlhB|nr:flagellar biosynthesis protein FlhB [Treponema sp.]